MADGGLKIFGSGGGGGSVVSGLTGALGGFASGDLLGGAAGLLGGLFGSGNQSQTTTYDWSQLSPEMMAARNSAAGAATSAGGRLSAGYDDFINSIRSEMDTVARGDIDRVFGRQRAKQTALAARSGGGLGSTQQYIDRENSRAMSDELVRALLGNRLGAEQMGRGREQGDIGILSAGTQGAANIEGSRRILSETGTAQGNTLNDMLAGMMGAATNPLSAYNTAARPGKDGTGGSWMQNYGGGNTWNLLEQLKEIG